MKNYVVYRCNTCGTEFILPREHVDLNDNYLTCPKHGRHDDIRVVGAYDSLRDCMRERKYRRNERGAIEQV